MKVTELKLKYNERIISQAATEIVAAGLSKIAASDGDYNTPLAAEIRRCFEDINNSSWDEIRSVIKRML